MLVDDEGEQVNVMARPMIPRDLQDLPRNYNPESVESGIVSCIHKCISANAKQLCIYDISRKLTHGGEYDIGGTYTEGDSDLWFYYSTSICPGYNYLLNLFVCHRKVGNFAVGVSYSNDLTLIEASNGVSRSSTLPITLAWHKFNSAQPNEIFHIKTFCFNEKSVKTLDDNTLFIPISIIMNCNHTINSEVIMCIKLQHDLSNLLAKKETTDFVLVSADGQKFPVHKIIIVAHSSLLRKLVKSTEKELFLDVQGNDVELLLEFLYTGTIKDIAKQDCRNLLKIADTFQLTNLFLLTQHALGNQISIESAVDIALLTQKYKLDKLQKKVFRFIKDNPKVMQTKSWKELKDINLTKQLIEHVYSGCD